MSEHNRMRFSLALLKLHYRHRPSDKVGGKENNSFYKRNVKIGLELPFGTR